MKTLPLFSNAPHLAQPAIPQRALSIAASLGIFLVACVIGPSHAATVTTNGFDLRVNGNRMVIKGMNYSPVPIGTVPGNAPYGDYFTPEYKNVWMPDIRSMRAAGVNAIKLYAGNPALNAGEPGSSGNWKEFLDACYNRGTDPIYVGQSQGATPFLMTATNDDYTPTLTWPAIQQGESSQQLGNLDAWGINVYRGPLFGGAGNSLFLQYKQLMASLNKRKPLILGEWGTPHSTRAIGVYGKDGNGGSPINLDTISPNHGTGQTILRCDDDLAIPHNPVADDQGQRRRRTEPSLRGWVHLRLV
jgi:hypothetical protein